MPFTRSGTTWLCGSSSRFDVLMREGHPFARRATKGEITKAGGRPAEEAPVEVVDETPGESVSRGPDPAAEKTEEFEAKTTQAEAPKGRGRRRNRNG